jgi:hypothetical protein
VPHIIDMIDDPDMLLPTELNVTGTFFDVSHMLRLAAAQKVGLWHWSDWETAFLYRDHEWKSQSES